MTTERPETCDHLLTNNLVCGAPRTVARSYENVVVWKRCGNADAHAVPMRLANAANAMGEA